MSLNPSTLSDADLASAIAEHREWGDYHWRRRQEVAGKRRYIGALRRYQEVAAITEALLAEQTMRREAAEFLKQDADKKMLEMAA